MPLTQNPSVNLGDGLAALRNLNSDFQHPGGVAAEDNMWQARDCWARQECGPVWAAPTPRSRQENHLINNLLHRLRRGLQMGLERIWLVFKEGVSERLSFKIAQNPGYENRWAWIWSKLNVRLNLKANTMERLFDFRKDSVTLGSL